MAASWAIHISPYHANHKNFLQTISAPRWHIPCFLTSVLDGLFDSFLEKLNHWTQIMHMQHIVNIHAHQLVWGRRKDEMLNKSRQDGYSRLQTAFRSLLLHSLRNQRLFSAVLNTSIFSTLQRNGSLQKHRTSWLEKRQQQNSYATTTFESIAMQFATSTCLTLNGTLNRCTGIFTTAMAWLKSIQMPSKWSAKSQQLTVF